MGATLDETRVELAAKRAQVRATADEVAAAGRRAVDLQAMVRRNPLRVAALVGGVAFFAFGGPRRAVRAVRRAFRDPVDGERAYAALPGSLRALVDATAPGGGAAKDEARGQMALALHAWREDPKNRKRAVRLISQTLSPPGAERALWAMVEVVAVTAAGLIARQVVARRLVNELLSSRPSRPGAPTAAPSAASAATPPGQYSGWSGQRRSPAQRPAESASHAEPGSPTAKSS